MIDWLKKLREDREKRLKEEDLAKRLEVCMYNLVVSVSTEESLDLYVKLEKMFKDNNSKKLVELKNEEQLRKQFLNEKI
jgi:hypothetical protein